MAISITGQAFPDQAHWLQPLIGGVRPRAALFPQSCGQCHPGQLADWSASRHAQAFSPGLLGQLLTFSSCSDVLVCLKCHAPLAEQQEVWSACEGPGEVWSHKSGPWLVESGVGCGVCHVRGGKVVAPSRVGGEGVSQAHPGMERVDWFRDSRLCSHCHQLAVEVNGKPLQNTFEEWKATTFAAQGIGCQGCHMAGGAHLFRGIHHPEMVAQGLEVEAELEEGGGVYVVRSTGIGHLFPTYTVPRVTLEGRLLDGEGQEIARRQWVVQRQVVEQGGRLVELSDTRLGPGEVVRLRVPWQVDGRWGREIRFALVVEPDYHYQTQVFPVLLREESAGLARTLIDQAARMAGESRYVLFEKRVVRPL